MRTRIAVVAAATLAGGLLTVVPAAHAAATTYTWTGKGNDGSWTTAQNWSPNSVPGNGDSVVIAPPADGCATHVTDVPKVALVDFSLSENRDCLASVEGGAVSVSGAFTFSGGEIETPLTLLASSTGTVRTPRVPDTSEFTQNTVVRGSLTLNGNTESDSVDHAVRIAPGKSLTIAAGATLTTRNTNVIEASSCCLDPARLVNNGTIDAKDDLTISNTELDQNGTLDAEGRATEVASLISPNTAGPGARWIGSGTYRVTDASSSVTLTGAQSLGPNFHFALGGNTPLSPVFADGNESLHGTFRFTGSGEFDWRGGHVSADATIAHTVRTVIDGNVKGGGNTDPRQLDDQDSPVDGGATTVAKIVNHGPVSLSNAPAIRFAGNARLYNESDGTVSIAPGSVLRGDCCVTQGRVVNHGGAVRVPAGPTAGKPVSFRGVGYSSTGGSTSIGKGARIALRTGATSLLRSTTLSGGEFDVAAPLHLSKTITVTGTQVALETGGSAEDVVRSGKTRESATLAGSGTLHWTGGSLAGLLNVHLGGVSISGTHDKNVTGTSDDDSPSIVSITSPLTIAAGPSDQKPDTVVVEQGGSALNLAGSTSLAANVTFFGGRIHNSATLTAAPGSGKRDYVTGGATFLNTGAVTVRSGTLAIDNDYRQTSGTTSVTDGATLREIGSSAKVRLLGGTLTGAGTVWGDTVNAAGTVSPAGTGRLSVRGDYTSRSTSRLRFDLATASKHGVLAVSGAATVAGRISAHNAYPPKAGNKASVVTAATSLTLGQVCTITSGEGSTGAAARHWVATRSGRVLVLESRSGSKTRC